MPRAHRWSLAIAPWIVAGALLLGGTGAVAADGAIPAAVSDASSSTSLFSLSAGATVGLAETIELSQVASADVGSDAMTGGGSYAVGALVGAVVAVVAALRERFRGR